jgi:membrane fusion protein, multidrug efflux system
VSQGPQGPSVYVLGANDVAEVRPIRLGPEVAAGWVVQEGLGGSERVVADGVIRVRPGQPVRPAPLSAGPKPARDSKPPG